MAAPVRSVSDMRGNPKTINRSGVYIYNNESAKHELHQRVSPEQRAVSIRVPSIMLIPETSTPFTRLEIISTMCAGLPNRTWITFKHTSLPVHNSFTLPTCKRDDGSLFIQESHEAIIPPRWISW